MLCNHPIFVSHNISCNMDSLPIIPLLSIYTIINNKNTIHYREFQKKYGLLSGTMTETDYFSDIFITFVEGRI